MWHKVWSQTTVAQIEVTYSAYLSYGEVKLEEEKISKIIGGDFYAAAYASQQKATDVKNFYFEFLGRKQPMFLSVKVAETLIRNPNPKP